MTGSTSVKCTLQCPRVELTGTQPRSLTCMWPPLGCLRQGEGGCDRDLTVHRAQSLTAWPRTASAGHPALSRDADYPPEKPRLGQGMEGRGPHPSDDLLMVQFAEPKTRPSKMFPLGPRLEVGRAIPAPSLSDDVRDAAWRGWGGGMRQKRRGRTVCCPAVGTGPGGGPSSIHR